MKPMYIEAPIEWNTNLGKNFMDMIMSLPPDNDGRIDHEWQRKKDEEAMAKNEKREEWDNPPNPEEGMDEIIDPFKNQK